MLLHSKINKSSLKRALAALGRGPALVLETKAGGREVGLF